MFFLFGSQNNRIIHFIAAQDLTHEAKSHNQRRSTTKSDVDVNLQKLKKGPI